jgi:hypothetical protein
MRAAPDIENRVTVIQRLAQLQQGKQRAGIKLPAQERSTNTTFQFHGAVTIAE